MSALTLLEISVETTLDSELMSWVKPVIELLSELSVLYSVEIAVESEDTLVVTPLKAVDNDTSVLVKPETTIDNDTVSLTTSDIALDSIKSVLVRAEICTKTELLSDSTLDVIPVMEVDNELTSDTKLPVTPLMTLTAVLSDNTDDVRSDVVPLRLNMDVESDWSPLTLDDTSLETIVEYVTPVRFPPTIPNTSPLLNIALMSTVSPLIVEIAVDNESSALIALDVSPDIAVERDVTELVSD